MQILNIAGYKFISLSNLPPLREQLLTKCLSLGLKGTILLSSEGINLNLAGETNYIELFKQFINSDSRFSDMTFRESYSTYIPFKHMRVKLKKEIITMRQSEIRPDEMSAPSITPKEFKQWLDENKDITILDTRNEYEVRFGTFQGATNLHLDDFCDFPNSAEKIPRNKPVVMFCTGGIRCEKAALHLLKNNFPEVYQLQGGILNYFAKIGGSHYDGECFVFDQRVALNEKLQETGSQQCLVCQGPIKTVEQGCPICKKIA